MPISDAALIAGNFDYLAALNATGDPYWKDISFGSWNGRYGTWSAMLGARFSF